MTPPRRAVRLGCRRCRWPLLMLVAGLVGALNAAVLVHADEVERYSPSSRGGRPWVAAVLEERALAHDVRPGLLTRLAVCEVGPDLNPRAVGDYGHSLGLAQLSDLNATGNLRGHFFAVGYDDPTNAYQAADYLARAVAGEFVDARWGRIGPWRWSCWRLVR